MIDLAKETPIATSELARRQPSYRGNKPMTHSAVLRWVLHGVKGADGRTVKLEALRVGGRWVTTLEAFQRFAEAQTPSLNDDAPSTRTETARTRAAAKASEVLSNVGI
jgi:hypothetical protein